MPAPTLIRVGNMWQVTYASGEVKTHAQSWQALIYFHQAQHAANNSGASVHAPDPTNHAASTSSTIPNAPFDDYANCNRAQD